MNNLLKILTGVAVTVLFSAPVLGASDGTIGTTSSTGQSDLSLSVPDLVKISNVKDIALGTYSGTGDMVENTSYCVYRNGGDDYNLTLSTEHGAFEVQDVNTNAIPFAVTVDDDNDASDGSTPAYNTAEGPLVGSSATDCGGTDNGAMEVTFAESDLQAASTETYSATVTLLVEPI